MMFKAIRGLEKMSRDLVVRNDEEQGDMSISFKSVYF